MVGTMLLDVAVYPNLICSLMHGLGSMAPAQAWKFSAQCGNVTSRCGLGAGRGRSIPVSGTRVDRPEDT